MFRTLALTSLIFAGGLVAACGNDTETTSTPVEPAVVFPDMPDPGTFNRAYTLTENADGTIRIFSKETRDDTDLFWSQKSEDGSWSEPEKLDWPKLVSNTNPHFSPFDGRLYFASDRPVPGLEGRKDMNIWSIAWTGDDWDDARPVTGEVNTGSGETSVTTTSDGTMFFVSKHARGKGGQDIFKANYNAETESWVLSTLPDSVNSPRVETHVAATPDGQHVIFYSYRSPKLGVVDLVAISQDENGNWVGPYNIGPLINTRGIDFGAGMSADGETFFFSREGVLMSLPMEILLEELETARTAFEAGEEAVLIGLETSE